jgi:uncharacterized protein (DUF433 family)
MVNSYTPAQAAATTGLSLAAIHKAIDTGLIKAKTAGTGGTVRRLLTREQIVYLQLEAEGVRLLPLSARRSVAKAMRRSPQIDEVALGNGHVLLIKVSTARRKAEEGLRRLLRAEKMVMSDPEILGGTPVYRKTRIPVRLVADMLAQGASTKEILEGYPSLSREMVESAPIYVRAFPRRGRPARRPWARQKPRRVTNHPQSALDRHGQ